MSKENGGHGGVVLNMGSVTSELPYHGLGRKGMGAYITSPNTRHECDYSPGPAVSYMEPGNPG